MASESIEIDDDDKDESMWVRVFMVAVFWMIFYLTQLVMLAIVVGQCAFLLITGSPNDYLKNAGDSISKYVSEILSFATFNSDRRPFPFSRFPTSDVIDV
ncbi:MAG: DUF4389 domain-containing protein [Proteobacteria bacterium]|jgi:hypothetical protein|nr:DUF4389 domain-containing protein [Pseudomonadota bacterium]